MHLVVNEENGLVVFLSVLHLLFRDIWNGALHAVPYCHWQIHAERRPTARHAVHFYEAIMVPDNPIDRRQSQTRSQAGLLGGEEGVEDTFANLTVHTRTGIGNR